LGVKQLWRQNKDSLQNVSMGAERDVGQRDFQHFRSPSLNPGTISLCPLPRNDSNGINSRPTRLIRRPFSKKSKNLHKHSCGFPAIRIDHGHQSGGHI
jgi:hypothetical protein